MSKSNSKNMDKRVLGVVLVLLASLFWSTYGTAVKKLGGYGFSSVEPAEIRTLLGAFFCAIYMLFTNRSAFRIKLKDIWCFLGTGILNMVLNGLCYSACILESSVGVAAVFNQTGPIFALILGIIVFKEELTSRKILAILFTFGGCVMASGIIGSLGTRISLLAVILGLGAGIGWSMYAFFSRFAINKGYSPLTVTFYSLLISSIFNAFFTDWGKVAEAAKSPSALFWMVVIGLCVGFLGFVLYTKGLEYIETGVASILCSIDPVLAAMWGMILLGEKLTSAVSIGIILIICGIIIVNVKGPSRTEKKIKSYEDIK